MNLIDIFLITLVQLLIISIEAGKNKGASSSKGTDDWNAELHPYRHLYDRSFLLQGPRYLIALSKAKEYVHAITSGIDAEITEIMVNPESFARVLNDDDGLPADHFNSMITSIRNRPIWKFIEIQLNELLLSNRPRLEAYEVFLNVHRLTHAAMSKIMYMARFFKVLYRSGSIRFTNIVKTSMLDRNVRAKLALAKSRGVDISSVTNLLDSAQTDISKSFTSDKMDFLVSVLETLEQEFGKGWSDRARLELI
jgi:hypothetical protein